VGWRRTARIGHLLAPLPPDIGEFELPAVIPVPSPLSFSDSSNLTNLPASRGARGRAGCAGERGAGADSVESATTTKSARGASLRTATGVISTERFTIFCEMHRPVSRHRRCTLRPATRRRVSASPGAARPSARRLLE